MSTTITMSNYIFNTNTDAYSKVVYAAIKKYSNSEGKCFPSRNTLAQLCKISLSTLRKAINNLVDANVLDKKYRYRENKSQTSNLYTLTSFMTSGDYYFKVRADIFELDLAEIETVVYMYLCSCANKNNECYPSIRQIALACGIGQTSVKTAIKELVAKKLILKINQFREDGGKRNNLYKLVTEDIEQEDEDFLPILDNESTEDETHGQGTAVKVNEKVDDTDIKTKEIEITEYEEPFHKIEAKSEGFDVDDHNIHLLSEEENKNGKVNIQGNIFDFKLPKNSLMVYLYISTYNELNKGKLPSYEQIALNCKISNSKVEKTMLELRSLGLIERFEQGQLSNGIVTTEPPP